MKMNGSREFGLLDKKHILLIRKWRNEQIDILRQAKRITKSQQISWFENLKNDKRQKLFVIYQRNDKEKVFIGYCGLTNLDHVNNHAEVSFLVDTKRTQNFSLYKQDMLASLNFLTDYAFCKLRLKKIFTETFSFRRKHIAILEKFGFRREGIFKCHIYLKGCYYDSIMHGLLRENYIKMPINRERK